MSVKYHCPKCQRRFVDWGAQKLEFTCPDCEVELVQLGGTTGKTKSKPSLRRPVPTSDSGPRRVTSFDTEGDEDAKPVAVGGGDEEEFGDSGDSGGDFDEDDGDIDLSGDDDDAVEVDDSDD